MSSERPKLQVITPNERLQTDSHPTTVFVSGPTDVPWRKEFYEKFWEAYRIEEQKAHEKQVEQQNQQQEEQEERGQQVRAGNPNPNPTSAPTTIKIPSLKPLTFYDPYQPNWDSTWKEDYNTDARYKAQTDWELAHIASSTFHVSYFDPRAKAPVTLLEFGLTAWHKGKDSVLVGCPPGFWKRGNVVAVCQRRGILVEDSLDGLVKRLLDRARE
ncbi:hypothetical protein BD289DRAFT_481552 [Coniella lustricola]|uniref:Uncharacterized protein n=1 Tax=Coniella lustricola TaxID=2025994 RepID=A0A2T3ABP7_9PEZI|nr:hypothetical protein BD289DRAFT_481552 [Coniella lustricola]